VKSLISELFFLGIKKQCSKVLRKLVDALLLMKHKSQMASVLNSQPKFKKTVSFILKLQSKEYVDSILRFLLCLNQ